MIARDLVRLVEAAARPVVEFGKGIEEMECYVEPGMRARIKDARIQGDMVKITFDVTEFEDANRPFETADWNGRDGEANLTAREAGYYPENGLEAIWWEVNDNVDAAFAILTNDPRMKVLAAFRQAADPGANYVTWLEDLVIAAGALPGDAVPSRTADALERLLVDFRAVLAGKPVKDADEAVGEAETALRVLGR